MIELMSILGLTILTVHEFDAVRQKEWSMFWYLNKLNDEFAYWIFTLLHIPIYFFVFWGLFGAGAEKALVFTDFINLFFIIHLLLHIGFIKHRNNNFNSFYSWVLIIIPALCGISHFVVF